MPELPEVETTRRHLEKAVVGSRVTRVDVRRRRMVRRQEPPADFQRRLEGRKISALDRVGKFLLGRLDGDLTWVTHLGMSGRLQVVPGGTNETPHTNVVVGLESDAEVRFVDPRTFGFMAVYTPEELSESSVAALGSDALDDLPRSPLLGEMLAGRTASIKALLLDQRLIAGLGNIYADEVLHRARLNPLRSGGSLDPDEVKALRAAIRPVLQAGLAAGGTSLGDMAYLLPDGRAGGYMPRLRVYGRRGERCLRCGGTVQVNVVRGRSTHWCAGCQR